MLNLNEEWKKAYDEFLLEEEAKINNDIESIFVELSEAQERTENAYQILSDYYTILSEKLEEGERAEANMYNDNSRRDEKPMASASDTFKNVLGLFSNDIKLDNDDYAAVTQYKTERISEMKFPKNIIFFITQIIKWIKNVVMYFIDRFLNIIRRLTGHKEKELDPRDLELKFEKAKEIETISSEVSVGKKGPAKLLALRPNDIVISNQDFTSDPRSAGTNTTPIHEGILDFYDEKKEDKVNQVNIVVSIDLSKDLMNLKEYIQHFYDLYDKAYGSNNEKLFDTEDLEIILTALKNTINNINFGTENVFKADGIAFAAPEVSSSKVRDTLITTNANIASLKNAYVKTSESISKISQIINSKEMMMVASGSANYTLLSSSTYSQMSVILESILYRLKESTKMEKKLSDIQKRYDKLCAQLSSVQSSFLSLGKVSFDTPYNKKMLDVISSAKMMSQVVTLRLTALGMYIKELKDIRDEITMLANINTGSAPSILKYKKGLAKNKSVEKKLYKF